MEEIEVVKDRLISVKEIMSQLEKSCPLIKLHVLSAPAGRCSYEYKKKIHLYRKQLDNYEAGKGMFKRLTGKEYEV